MSLTESDLPQVFPVNYADADVSTQLTLLQFLAHLAYRSGQIDYYRRAVTRNPASADAISAAALIES